MKDNLIHYRTAVCNINYHIVWSVKYRRKILTPEVELYLKHFLILKRNFDAVNCGITHIIARRSARYLKRISRDISNIKANFIEGGKIT